MHLLIIIMGTSFFRFVTIHASDRQTDGQTERKGYEIPCVAIAR